MGSGGGRTEEEAGDGGGKDKTRIRRAQSND